MLRRPDLGLVIALPRDRRIDVRVEDGRWTTLRNAAPGWTALLAEGAASSRFELAVSAWPIADTRAAVLAAVAETGAAGAAAEDMAIGPWRGVAATSGPSGEETPGVRIVPRRSEPVPRRVLRRVVARLFTARAAHRLLPAPAPPRRAERRRAILLDAGARQIRLSLAGHADAPEAWAVLEAVAGALRPA